MRCRLIVLLSVCAILTMAAASARAASHYKSGGTAARPGPFVHYFLGDSFKGDPLTDKLYDCGPPSRPPEPPIRINRWDYGYGDCEAPCALPVSVQTTPACDSWWGQYNLGLPDGPIRRPRLTRVRGVPAARLEGGHHLDLYTGDVTVTIFANSRKRANHAAARLRHDPDDSPGGADVGEPLPPPLPGALRGDIDCGFRFETLAIRARRGAHGWRAVVRLKVGRPAYMDVELERREKHQWVGDEQAFWSVGRGTSGHRIPIRAGRYRATVFATDHSGRRTRVRTLHFRTSDKE